MRDMKPVNVFALIISLLIPLTVGTLSALITAKDMFRYGEMQKPRLSPPGWLFPIAWTILYILMGIAAYFVYVEPNMTENRTAAIVLYVVQLVMNFCWSIVFFKWGYYLLAFVWLIALMVVVIFCMIKFYSVSRIAGCLMIPYVVWMAFAAYLNMGVYLLSSKEV